MTRATIAGFVTRADADLVQPRSVSRNIQPWQGGMTGHYWGVDLALHRRAHADCVQIWKDGQAFHMRAPRNYVDIAYTGGFCPHGYAFAGRGFGIRTAANGTNPGNDFWYATCYLGGPNDPVTPEALGALAWWIREARRAGAAGDRVVPHSFHKQTSCPGPVQPHLAQFNRQPIEGDRTVSHEHFGQMVLGANQTDIDQGLVAAARWDAAVGLYKLDGSIEVYDGPHKGKEATADFAWLVGSAAKIRHDGQFEHGVIRLAGETRRETGDLLGAALENHPHGSINRRGRPW